MKIEKSIRGFRLRRLDNGHIQVYAKQRSRQLAAIGIKHSAWRLAFELSPAMISDLYDFMKECTPTPSSTIEKGNAPAASSSEKTSFTA